jgi:hypothetical protein
MYYRDPPAISIVLMSRRPGAPYEDSLSEDGMELVYEGHDMKKGPGVDPKLVDQPWVLPSGEATDNAKFTGAAECSGVMKPLVRVYEKLRPGIWSDKGLFELVGHEYKQVSVRKVFKFRMQLSAIPDDIVQGPAAEEFKRAIPAWVKQVVYKRDKRRCVICGAQDQLHFDHDLPFSKGGTGLSPANVRILCARHNLQKGARIE